ncbi:hypothetical protein HPB50_014899 [Hyalomma asiaticum]|uniref:Uncharacterized protein n=1 Tax=Hyalomma asiaticum TaxID=266040 RepID=A0ACB7T4L7_HYAAI|nr:hypothetical protein HPB50_014899 [Hyalomma asiaticum]
MRDDPKVKQNTQADVEPQPVDTENDVSDMQPDPQIPAPFQPESTQAGQLIQAALQKRVAQLETQLQATRRKLHLAQRQRLQALTANKRLVAGLSKYLNEDQVKCLKMATMQGTRWTKNTVIKALKMRLSCGARGYDSVRELGQPLPTERTLHRHLEGYKFTPGLLEDIMESLALKVSLMSPEERHATLMLDEMQLAPGLVYNPSSGTVLGAPTIPLADATLPPDSLATHGLVFMLGGITTRWKQTVAYHLTGNSFHAKTVKDIIIVIIRACEAISLKVDVVVTDMGGGNQAVWKLFGIIVGKHSKPKTWCPHPCDASRQLFFMADVPHLLKNLRSHLTKGQKIYLPEEVVKKNNLPGNEISIEPVKKLVEIDSNAELKLAPHLKPSSVDPSHYDKMKAMFLEKYNFKFLLLSRFSQDALENLFSTLRCKNPVPRVLEFKSSLRAATMAQFLRPSKDGSYTEEDCFLLTGTADDNKPNESKMYVVRPSDLLDIQDLEHESLEYLAGYVVAQVKKANSCQACVEAITSSAEGNKLTMLKCYNKEKPALTVPSPAVLKLIETAENYVTLTLGY